MSATSDATYTVLSAIENGITTRKKLAEQLKKHKSNISRQVKKAKYFGLVTTIGKSPAVLELTGKGKIFIFHNSTNKSKVAQSSLCAKNKNNIRLHRLSMKFKILDDSKDSVQWEETPVKNWTKKIMKIDKFEGLNHFKYTIEKTPKHIILYGSAELPRDNYEAAKTDFVLRLVRHADYWLKKRGVYFNDLSGETSNQHLAVEEKTNEYVDKHTTVEIDLGRTSTSFFKTKMAAKAWLDWSKKKDKSILDIESNDFSYNEKLVMVPEYVAEMYKETRELSSVIHIGLPALGEYNKNLKLHIEVQKRQLKTQNGQLETQRNINKGISELRGAIGEMMNCFHSSQTEQANDKK